MLRRGPGGGQRLFFSVALLSLGAVSAAGTAYRAPLEEIWQRLRIRWQPAHVFDLLDRDADSPGGKAARWYAQTKEGTELLLRAYLEKQLRGVDLESRIPGREEVSLKSARALVLGRRPKGTISPGDHSRSIQLLLGEVGAEGLTAEEYRVDAPSGGPGGEGADFSFVWRLTARSRSVTIPAEDSW